LDEALRPAYPLAVSASLNGDRLPACKGCKRRIQTQTALVNAAIESSTSIRHRTASALKLHLRLQEIQSLRAEDGEEGLLKESALEVVLVVPEELLDQ